jgi:hypothetical protein
VPASTILLVASEAEPGDAIKTILSGAGIVVAVAKRQPWYWVLGAWAAPWVHHLAFSLLPNHEFIC